MPRKTKSVKVLIESVFNSSGNHGIREIEFYNDYCKPGKSLHEVRSEDLEH